MGHQLCRNLKALLSYAVERDLIPVNPLLRIKLPKLESRERVLIALPSRSASRIPPSCWRYGVQPISCRSRGARTSRC